MIVPRWEWRTFGDSFGEAEARLAALQPTKVDDSDELYILSSRVEGSIKVRGGQLDVKRLEEVSDDGLEQWRPVAKAEFPLAATDVASLLGSLDVTVPSLDRDTYDLDELVEEVVATHDELLAVPVPKHRAHYLLDGCMAELTDVRPDARTTRTIAVETEDPARRSLDGRGARAAVAAERQLPARPQRARRLRRAPVRRRSTSGRTR